MRFSKSIPLYVRVEEFLREQIRTGVYPVNGKLPTTPALARITGTSVCTVQAALSKLHREGLVDRKTGRGTYVKGNNATLTCAGMYLNRPFSRSDPGFYQMLTQEIRRKLTERGVRTRFWTDEREDEEQGKVIASLHRAMEKREIQALIAPLTGPKDPAWLNEVPIALAAVTTDLSLNNRVNNSFAQTILLGLEELRSQGCRKVAVITNLMLNVQEKTSAEYGFYGSLIDSMNDMGFEIRNEWIRFMEDDVDPDLAHYGYEQFQQLWNSPHRPEALLVYPDGVAMGVTTSILEKRISVPKDLKVVFYENDLLPYVCPFEATYLRAHVGLFADQLIQMIDTQLAGGEVLPVQVPISVIRPGDSGHPQI